MEPNNYYPEVPFTGFSDGLQKTFRLCSYENASVSAAAIQVLVHVTGTNSADYVVTGGSCFLNVTLVNPALPPTLTLTVPTFYDSGRGNFNILSTINGMYYYSLREGVYSADDYNFSFYRQMIFMNNYTIQDQSDFLKRLYATPRSFTINYHRLAPEIATEFLIAGFLPETSYTLCAYYQNVAGSYSAALGCSVF